jgi:hypothetical protein
VCVCVCVCVCVRERERERETNCLNVWQLLIIEKLNFLMNNKITISHAKLV